MEGWMLAIVLKPIGLLFFFFFVAVFAHRILKPIFPDGPLKEVLYDKTFRDRNPGTVTALIIGFYVVFISYLAWFMGSH